MTNSSSQNPRRLSHYCRGLLFMLLFTALSNAMPAIALVIDNDSSVLLGKRDFGNRSPQRPSRAYFIQLAILGIAIILLALLIFCLCRRPFSSRWVSRQAGSNGASPPRRNELPRSASSFSSSATDTSFDHEMRDVGGMPYSVSLEDSKKVKNLDADDGAATGRLRVHIDLPPLARTRPSH